MAVRLRYEITSFWEDGERPYYADVDAPNPMYDRLSKEKEGKTVKVVFCDLEKCTLTIKKLNREQLKPLFALPCYGSERYGNLWRPDCKKDSHEVGWALVATLDFKKLGPHWYLKRRLGYVPEVYVDLGTWRYLPGKPKTFSAPWTEETPSDVGCGCGPCLRRQGYRRIEKSDDKGEEVVGRRTGFERPARPHGTGRDNLYTSTQEDLIGEPIVRFKPVRTVIPTRNSGNIGTRALRRSPARDNLNASAQEDLIGTPIYQCSAVRHGFEEDVVDMARVMMLKRYVEEVSGHTLE